MPHQASRLHSISIGTAWKAVLTRNGAFDGAFVYAVTSTRIYCRPSCPARRPAYNRVRFFETPEQAELAGFRACQRCRPTSDDDTRTVQRIAQVRRYLDGHPDERVTLETLAKQVNLSPFHFQRVFTRIVGMSPAA